MRTNKLLISNTTHAESNYAKLVSITIIFMVSIFYAANLNAQGRNMNRMYNPDTETTVKAKIAEVKQVQMNMGRGMNQGIHLILDNQEKIHLGPAWYFEEQDLQFNKGEIVEITGSKISYQNEQIIIARQIKQNGHVVELRDEAGIPYWAGQGRRRWN